MQKPHQLKTYFDELEETNGDDECKAWLSRVFDAKIELGIFVASHRGGRVTEYVGFLKGSFNFSLRFKFSDSGPDAIIRFPKPGHTDTTLRDEKVTNEAQIMDYLTRNTTIPIPRVHSWGLTADCPQQFGPFIIMDFVDGTLLSSILKKPTETEQEELVLNPDIDEEVLDKVYSQIGSYMLQLSQLSFSNIGAISKDEETDTWSVTRRPLTYNMNELASVAKFPRSQLPDSRFSHASEYFRYLADAHLTHLRTQRNIADDREIAQARYLARHHFAQLIPEYCIHDAGPFIPFCDDLRPSNMLVDPETLQITAVIDLEYTNAMPAQFTYDPPWWLLLSGPEIWLERYTMTEFQTLYEPRMEQFLRALCRVESGVEFSPDQSSAVRLSERMREAWQKKRFWFNYAARKSFEVDIIYWAAFNDGARTSDIPGIEGQTEMETFIQEKMDQLKAYKQECSARFSDKPT
ncbi:hypothetical protein MBLNU459_g0079t1 [Dothideomycetes sp. NU459]